DQRHTFRGEAVVVLNCPTEDITRRKRRHDLAPPIFGDLAQPHHARHNHETKSSVIAFVVDWPALAELHSNPDAIQRIMPAVPARVAPRSQTLGHRNRLALRTRY